MGGCSLACIVGPGSAIYEFVSSLEQEAGTELVNTRGLVYVLIKNDPSKQIIQC